MIAALPWPVTGPSMTGWPTTMNRLGDPVLMEGLHEEGFAVGALVMARLPFPGSTQESARRRENLARAMITGRRTARPAPARSGAPSPRGGGSWRRFPVTRPSAHSDDPHFIERSNWLRAAVLGANDGIVSVSSLVVGVAAAQPDPAAVVIAGVAGLAAGAMSMAAGECVSVSSQSDIERADERREDAALRSDPQGELAELAALWRERGLSPETADRVARELTEHDALAAHMRDELGVTETLAAHPLQAAAASGATFSAAAALPVAATLLSPPGAVVPVVLVTTVLALVLLGVLGARAGGAPIGRAVLRAVLRVVLWGAFAMGVTAAIGRLFGVAV